MSFPSIKFKRALCANDRDARYRILESLRDWMMKQIPHDPGATACATSLSEAHAVNSWASNKEFKEHYFWFAFQNHDKCVSFQEIVKAKLAVPKTNIAAAISAPAATQGRKTIPKKIRGEAWKTQFGDSTQGACYCCRKTLDIFDDWHAGHIVSHVNGGSDTAVNLRPVCGSCNLSMGTENMDAFKARCYPHTATPLPDRR